MKFQIEDLGVIRKAELELGKLTIICGKNNSGKSYITNALFGFLHDWSNFAPPSKGTSTLDGLYENGSVQISVNEVQSNRNELLSGFCDVYQTRIPKLLAGRKRNFSKTKFRCTVDSSEFGKLEPFSQTFGSYERQLFSINLDPKTQVISVDLIGSANVLASMPRRFVEDLIQDFVRRLSFGSVFPTPLISSSERTGIATFRRNLDFMRDHLMKKIADGEKDLDPQEFLSEIQNLFPITIECNVDFSRSLEEASTEDSYLFSKFNRHIDFFESIAGGAYQIDSQGRLYFTPENMKKRLSMRESSSSVRALLDLAFYFKHVIQPGHMLMIDEPELSLHPVNQRKMARMIARLVNAGVSVFITTHSDYIIRELNSLIMMSHKHINNSKLLQSENYTKDELLKPTDVRLYVAQKDLIQLSSKARRSRVQTLVEVPLEAEFGMEVSAFDTEIDTINRVQDELRWGY